VLRRVLWAAVLVVCCAVPDYEFVQPSQGSCDDRLVNGSETDIDCGGSCQPCPNGRNCRQGSDCVVASCIDQTCQAPHCVDQMLSEGETDVDCGGLDCRRCGVRQGCLVATDCSSNACEMGVCIATGCDDGEVGGGETDLNCGGGT